MKAMSMLEGRRRAFLVGEGTLTAGEVSDWATEMRPAAVPIPAGIDEDTALMVAIVPKEATTTGLDPERMARLAAAEIEEARTATSRPRHWGPVDVSPERLR